MNLYNTKFTLCSHNTDFEPRIRDAVVDYMIERFGRDYVSNIGTFGISRTKVAIQDAGRVFSIPAQETLAVTKALGDDIDEDAPFSDAIEACSELKAYLEKWEKVGEEESLKPENERIKWREDLKDLRYFIEGIKGNVRQISQHAAGVLVSSDKLMENVALGRSRNRIVTGWQEGSDYHELSDLGYYKFDILGLNNLQVVNDCVSLIKQRHNKEIDWSKIDLNEKEVYEKIVAAQDHMGVFQFECLAGDTIVDGITIKERFERKILGEIRSIDETSQKIISNEVLGIANSGKKMLYEIELENGKTIRASKDHQFLTKTGWKRLEELTEDDEILSED